MMCLCSVSPSYIRYMSPYQVPGTRAGRPTRVPNMAGGCFTSSTSTVTSPVISSRPHVPYWRPGLTRTSRTSGTTRPTTSSRMSSSSARTISTSPTLSTWMNYAANPRVIVTCTSCRHVCLCWLMPAWPAGRPGTVSC